MWKSFSERILLLKEFPGFRLQILLVSFRMRKKSSARWLITLLTTVGWLLLKLVFSTMEWEASLEQDDFSCWKRQSVGWLQQNDLSCLRRIKITMSSPVNLLETNTFWTLQQDYIFLWKRLRQNDLSCWKRQSVGWLQNKYLSCLRGIKIHIVV